MNKLTCSFVLQRIIIVLMGITILAGCAGVGSQRKPAPVPEIRPGFLAGYLNQEALPVSLALLPPPPAEGSAAFALDKAVSKKSQTLRGTLRWELAIEDANLKFPEAAGSFSCALGIPISEQNTPHLYILLRRTLADAGFSTYTAKKHYQRIRPFMYKRESTCTPDDEDFLKRDGSYPSGHTAIGWAWALILSEIAPDRVDRILSRGRAFGESRIICNAHWHSDVVEGRVTGAATVARLHADPAFREDLAAAKAEHASMRAKGLKPGRDCAAETGALAVHWNPRKSEAEILESWHGEYPAARFNMLPEGQRDQAVGVIADPKTFTGVWKVFTPGEPVPEINFKENFVLFARNTMFYNRILISQVKVTNGVAEVLAMETMSAMPIEDNVAMSLAVVPRRGITAVKSGDNIIPLY